MHACRQAGGHARRKGACHAGAAHAGAPEAASFTNRRTHWPTAGCAEKATCRRQGERQGAGEEGSTGKHGGPPAGCREVCCQGPHARCGSGTAWKRRRRGQGPVRQLLVPARMRACLLGASRARSAHRDAGGAARHAAVDDSQLCVGAAAALGLPAPAGGEGQRGRMDAQAKSIREARARRIAAAAAGQRRARGRRQRGAGRAARPRRRGAPAHVNWMKAPPEPHTDFRSPAAQGRAGQHDESRSSRHQLPAAAASSRDWPPCNACPAPRWGWPGPADRTLLPGPGAAAPVASAAQVPPYTSVSDARMRMRVRSSCGSEGGRGVEGLGRGAPCSQGRPGEQPTRLACVCTDCPAPLVPGCLAAGR